MSRASTIRLIVVDDHHMARGGIRAMLDRFGDIEIVGEASNGREAVELCRQLRPDVVLMDLFMEDMDGFTATTLIAASCPEIRVLALTGYHDDDLVHRALGAGIAGYLVKVVHGEELAGAVRAAASGQAIFSPVAMESLMRLLGRQHGAKVPFTERTAPPNAPPTERDGRHDRSTAALTEREGEVLALMMRGLTDPQIAASLVVSTPAVKFHVHHILSKVGAANRTQAVIWALEGRDPPPRPLSPYPFE